MRKVLKHSNFLALDVGSKRIGVAVASSLARLPRPLITLTNDVELWVKLHQIVADEEVGTIIVGLPRNMEDNDTQQTRIIRSFTKELATQLSQPIVFQDEALSSKKAESELIARGKPYAKSDIDALSAALILEDYLQTSETLND